jgi:hypothetical protein
VCVHTHTQIYNYISIYIYIYICIYLSMFYHTHTQIYNYISIYIYIYLYLSVVVSFGGGRIVKTNQRKLLLETRTPLPETQGARCGNVG